MKQVHSENNASEVDILGHLGTFWDNSEAFLTSLEHLDCFPSHFRPFSPIIGSLKKMRDGRTDRRTKERTDRPSYRDAWTHLKIGKALGSTTEWGWKDGYGGPDPSLDFPTKFHTNRTKIAKVCIWGGFWVGGVGGIIIGQTVVSLQK